VTLDATDSQRATTLAAIIGRHVLREALGSDDRSQFLAANPRSRRTIHQATGIVLAQLGMPPEDALLMLQGHAFATSRSMMDVATDIVERRLAFRRQGGRIEVVP